MRARSSSATRRYSGVSVPTVRLPSCARRDRVVMRSLRSHESPSLARERGLAVPVSLRVAALRAALERVLDTPVQVLAEDGRTRIQASAPDRRDIATW